MTSRTKRETAPRDVENSRLQFVLQQRGETAAIEWALQTIQVYKAAIADPTLYDRHRKSLFAKDIAELEEFYRIIPMNLKRVAEKASKEVEKWPEWKRRTMISRPKRSKQLWEHRPGPLPCLNCGQPCDGPYCSEECEDSRRSEVLRREALRKDEK